MNRLYWQRLAEQRLIDTDELLKAQCWSAAYYLAGYAVECGLKSCVLHYLEKTGELFRDRKYLKDLGECWTHDFDKLVSLAGLTEELGKACQANAALVISRGVVKNWKETSRYDLKSETEARALHEAITHASDGVFPWIRTYW